MMAHSSEKLSPENISFRNINGLLSRYSEYFQNVYYPTQILIALGISNNTNVSSILDVGCGRTVRISLPLLNENLDVVSSDISEPVIREACSRIGAFPNSYPVLADGMCLPFKNEVFDLIINSETIDYMPSQSSFLAEAHRVLKKDGVFMISTLNKFGLQNLSVSLFAFIYKIAAALKIRPVRPLQADDRKGILTLSRFENLLSSAGFETVIFVGELGIFRILTPLFAFLHIKPLGGKLQSLLLIIDIKASWLMPRCLLSGWTVVCRKKQ